MLFRSVTALTLLDSKNNSASVAGIIAHPLVKARSKTSTSENVRATLWGVLQMHTKADCESVKVATRNEPLIFSKTSESIWSIDEALTKTEVPELAGLLNEYRIVTAPASFSSKIPIFFCKLSPGARNNRVSTGARRSILACFHCRNRRRASRTLAGMTQHRMI